MADRAQPGAVVDGFRIGECIHRGGNGAIYQVDAPAVADSGFTANAPCSVHVVRVPERRPGAAAEPV